MEVGSTICWHCGGEVADNQIKCPTCGAERLRHRQRPVASIAREQSKPARRVVSTAQGGTQPRKSGPSGGRVTVSWSESPKEGRTGRTSPQRKPAPLSGQRTGSSPPSQQGRMQPAPAGAAPRMIRRHEYEAILPETQGYDHVNWLRLCILAVLCVVLLVAGIYFFLRNTGPGQRLLAANGREASMAAYHEIGRLYMADGSLSHAITALEVAQYKDPDNLEVLIDLGKVYLGSGDIEKAELAFSRAITHWPAYPEPYQRYVDLLLEQDRSFEALALLEIAIKETEGSYFETLHAQLIPDPPSVSERADKIFEKEFTLEITTKYDDAEIYYTLNNKDPLAEGMLYTAPLHLTDDQTWYLRAVTLRNGMYSEEQKQTYNIIKPKPEMPKASLAPNYYDTVQTVSLRATDDVVAIYYTVDGTQPTINSTKFEGPITLRIGKTQLRAIAVNGEGIVSNEMTVEYECGGKAKSSMGNDDTIDNLTLFTTTRAEFEGAYGTPLEEKYDGEDPLGIYTKLTYPFGYAIFLQRPDKDDLVLTELSTTSSAFQGPRDTKVGSRMEDVVAAFRDVGGEYSAQGNRTLYTLTDDKLSKLGLLTKTDENAYDVSYYCQQKNGQFVALTYIIEDGLVVRIDWIQYDTSS